MKNAIYYVIIITVWISKFQNISTSHGRVSCAAQYNSMNRSYKNISVLQRERRSKDYRDFWASSKHKAYEAALVITGNVESSEKVIYAAFKRLFTLDASTDLTTELLASFVVKEAKKAISPDYKSLTEYDTAPLKERERILFAMMCVFGLSENSIKDIINCDKTYFDGFDKCLPQKNVEYQTVHSPSNELENKLEALVASLTVKERKFKKCVLIGTIITAIVFLIATVALILSYVFAPPTENERYFISGDFRYYTLDDGSLEVTMYLGSASSVTVPEEVNGKTVVSIGSEAFADCTELKKLSIPKTVLTVGTNAFESCTSLTTVEYPLGESDFANIIIAKGNEAFKNAEKLFSAND